MYIISLLLNYAVGDEENSESKSDVKFEESTVNLTWFGHVPHTLKQFISCTVV